jgi:predicted LPLAT superfamily acyltransferase
MTAHAWLEQRERANAAALRLLVWIALRLGRPIGRAVLAPASLSFLLFSARARAASRAYLGRLWGRPPTLGEVYRHFFAFATAALDRVFFLADRWELFDIRLHGESLLVEQLAGAKGCFLLGAHVGSFESLRALGRRRDVTVNLVMFEGNARNISRVTRALSPGLERDVISLGEPDSMIRVVEQLDRGAWVGMLGDRALSAHGLVKVSFLGGTVAMPTAPFRIAAMTGRPVILMLGLFRGGNRYDLHFETLIEEPVLSRAGRDETLRQWAQRFADRLAHYCHEAPYNWFNFYEFWLPDDPKA